MRYPEGAKLINFPPLFLQAIVRVPTAEIVELLREVDEVDHEDEGAVAAVEKKIQDAVLAGASRAKAGHPPADKADDFALAVARSPDATVDVMLGSVAASVLGIRPVGGDTLESEAAYLCDAFEASAQSRFLPVSTMAMQPRLKLSRTPTIPVLSHGVPVFDDDDAPRFPRARAPRWRKPWQSERLFVSVVKRGGDEGGGVTRDAMAAVAGTAACSVMTMQLSNNGSGPDGESEALLGGDAT